MAEGKKSFLLYADMLPTVKKMVEKDRAKNTNNAGELFLHLLEYVSDNNPEPVNDIVDLMFEPFKTQLKRDLVKWEEKSPQRAEKARIAGLASAEARKLKKELNSTNELKSELNSTKSTVSVSVNDSVNVSDSLVLLKKEPKEIFKFNFKNSLIDLGLKKELVDDWLKVRKTKRLTNTETAFNNLKIEFEKSGREINEIINHCVTSSWGGFKASWKWEENNSTVPQQNTSGNLIHTNG